MIPNRTRSLAAARVAARGDVCRLREQRFSQQRRPGNGGPDAHELPTRHDVPAHDTASVRNGPTGLCDDTGPYRQSGAGRWLRRPTERG